MKKLRFNLALVVSVAMALSLVSCENDLQAPTQETDFKAPLARTASSNSVNKLDASVVELAANDAATVAGVYLTGDGEAIRIVGVSIMGCLFLRGTQQHIILQKIGKN